VDIKRGRRNIVLMVMALMLVVAACSSSDSDDAATTTAASASEATTTTAPAATTTAPAATTTEAMTDAPPEPGPLGAVTLAPGEDIQIRSLQAITGDVAFLGLPNQRGTEFAIEDYGQIKGHSVTIGVPLDDLCSPEGGQAAGQLIAADDKVVGTIGTSCSSAAGAALPLISDAGGVLISPSNTAEKLTSNLSGTAGSDYRPGYYRTAHNDSVQGQAVALFVYNDLGFSTAATIHDGSTYADGLAAKFRAAFEELGGTIVAQSAVNVGDVDMVPVLTEIAAAEPEVLFYPIFMPEAGFIAQQAEDVAGFENVTMFGADGILVSNFMELPETEGTYFSGPDLNYGDNASETGTTQSDFLAKYEAEFGEAPAAPFWAHSYDATVLLLSSIDAVAIELDDGSLFIDRQALRDQLDSTSGFAGIIGTLACDEFGDCGAQKVAIVLHEDSSDVEAGKSNVLFTYSANE
jgi:branched-chain amino acid transport system substrate-binding protein